jgi:hypothetical protein
MFEPVKTSYDQNEIKFYLKSIKCWRYPKEIMGSCPGRVTPMIIKLVFVVSLLSRQH